MFAQPCFIRENSKELQDKVYRLGGRSGACIWDSEFNTLLVADKDHFRCYDDEWSNADLLISKGYIDCGTNEDLFLALAALRDDSDYMQWFVAAENESHPTLCKKKLIEEHTWWYELYRKMTVTELIKYFSKNESNE